MTLFDGGLFDPQQDVRRKRPAGYIPLFDDASLADEPVEEEAVTPQEINSVLSDVGRLTGGTLSRVGDALQMPGDYWRGVLAGTPGERVTGRELLRKGNLIGPEDNWGNFFGALATEIATDPLAMLSGPLKALTPAGQAAAKLAGTTGSLLETAPVALTRKAISTGMADDALPFVARRTKNALEATGRKISTFDPAVVGRPWWGQRTAQRIGTLDDLIKYADNSDEVEAAAQNLLGDKLATLRHQPLGKSFGVGLPLGDPLMVGDFLGKGFGDKYADALDTLGQAYRWSPVGRGMAAAFDNRVRGRLNPEEQITHIANWQARKMGGAQETLEHTLQLSKLRAAHPEVFADDTAADANARLVRYLEGPAVRKAEDVAYVESRPQLKAYADWFDSKRGTMLERSRDAGLNAEPLSDPYGLLWVPRHAEPALEMQAKRDRKLSAALSAFSPDALSRTDAMKLPGGITTIRELSQDANISGARRLKTTDEAAAQYIFDKINAMVGPDQPPIDMKKATHIARIMHALPEEVTQKAPLFGQHPTDMIGAAFRNKGEGIGTTGVLFDSLATMAKNQPYTAVEGGRHVSLQTALNRLGLKTHIDDVFRDSDDIIGTLPDGTVGGLRGEYGAAPQMRDRLAKLLGVDPDEINLNEFSIPEEHINRLARARDSYTSGEVANTLRDALDHYTAAWRNSILAWPARAVRDLYSGAVSNWLAGAFDRPSLFAARALIMEGPDSPTFLRALRQISRYNTDDGLHQFYADLASTGLMGGNPMTDVGASVRGARSMDAIIGSDPITMSSIGKALGSGWTRKDFFNWRSNLKPLAETTNPLLKAGERVNSLTDGINRLTGYLSLLQQGYEPLAAARIIKRAQVDYTTLTDFEKHYIKSFFPWYTFQSRMFREVLRQLAERPGGRYGQLIHAYNAIQDEGDKGAYIPSDLRSQFAFPIPAEWGGVPAPGTQTYLKDIDLPGFDQINMIETPGTLAGTAEGTARQIAMQLHPAARQLVELATGQDLYTKRPLGEGTSALDSLLRYATGNPNADVPAIIDKTAENLPFMGRPLGVLRSLTDTRGDQPLLHRAIKTGINATTGVKVQDVDRDRVVSDAIRQIEESIDPYTREFKQTYIPEYLKPQVPTWALERQAVSRALARQRRAARHPKKEKRSKKPVEAFGPLFD